MFGLLSLALLPLGLIILLASLQTYRNADLERRSAVRIAVTESARRLGSEMAVDIGTLRAATESLSSGESPDIVCERVRNILSTATGEPTAFILSDPQGKTVCGTRGIPSPAAVAPTTPIRATIDTHDALVRVDLPHSARGYRASAVYPREQLARIVTPADFGIGYRLSIEAGDTAIPLADTLPIGGLVRSIVMAHAVPQLPLTVNMQVRASPVTASQVLTMLMPLLMWAAAAAIGWLVVDRMLLRPLAELRAAIASYTPGMPFGAGRRMTTPAKEIRELGETFRTITETVAAHEAQLAVGLSRQTRLTREVHHRVKNNLQVIASLISLHARAAKSTEAIAAYASIQRRVDALAVVHRNHYAELEENRGVAVRSLVGEIAASLRATAPASSGPLHIAESAPYYVTQDVAVPLAFIITELVELAMLGDSRAMIHIEIGAGDAEGRSTMSIRSTALSGRFATSKLKQGYSRILEGLARQLRSTMAFDEQTGTYSLSFANAGTE